MRNYRSFASRRYNKGRKYGRPYSSPASASKLVSAVRRRRLIKTIRRVALKTAEPKSIDSLITAKTELYHNVYTPWTLNSSAQMPPQGALDSARIGDQIRTSGYKIKILFGQKADRPNVNFKIWVVKVPKDATYAYNSWFHPTTNNVLLDDINSDYCKVLHRMTLRPNEAGLNPTTNDEYTFVRSFWVKDQRLYKFGPAGAATTHNQDTIALLIAPYDAYGTLVTDNIAYVQILSTLHYRDP